jgi:hypothetical protein
VEMLQEGQDTNLERAVGMSRFSSLHCLERRLRRTLRQELVLSVLV